MAKISRMWNSRGQGTTEFALLVPLLLILVGGSTDLGLGFFASHIAQNAAREGARIAVTLQPFDKDTAKAAAEDKIPNTNLFSSFNAEVSDPTLNPDTNQLEITVKVTGTYNFTFLRLIDVFFGTFPDSLAISRETTMRYEFQAL